jgi:hypothetical protein
MRVDCSVELSFYTKSDKIILNRPNAERFSTVSLVLFSMK